MNEPTYLRAAVEDWKSLRISTEKLCELWEVNFYEALDALREKGRVQNLYNLGLLPTEDVMRVLDACSDVFGSKVIKREAK